MNAKDYPVIPCGVALIRRGKSILISQRMENDSFGSFWEFPGGRKNSGETFEECVAREVNEEIGIRVSVHEKFMEMKHEYHERVIWLNFYLCALLSGEPRPLECQNVKWVDVSELKSFRFPPANDKVIEKLNKVINSD